MPRTLLRLYFAATCVALGGCIDVRRVNTECRWSDSATGPLDLTKAADREHLRMDVKVAGELGLRIADIHYRTVPVFELPIRNRCMQVMYDSIKARHRVTEAQIHVALRYRVWWADILAVFLPMALLDGLSMALVTRRLCKSFDPDDRAMATISLALLTPLIAALGLGVTQFWAMAVESWFVRNEHVSFRAFQAPAIAHGWVTFFGILALSIAVAAIEFSRTPLSGGRRRPGALHRPPPAASARSR